MRSSTKGRKKPRTGRRKPAQPAESELLRTARSYLSEGRADFAAMILERAVAAEPEDLELRLALIQAEARLGRWQQCETHCRQLLHASPLHAEAWVTLLRALLQQGRRDEAADHLEAMPRIEASAAQLFALGSLCLEHGYLSEARAALQQAFDLQPALPGLALDLSRVIRFRHSHRPLMARMRALIATLGEEPLLEADVHFALGKAHEDLEEYEQAGGHYLAANRLVASTVRFDAQQHRRAVDAIIQTFDTGLLRRLSAFGNPSSRPILIVGMPRSGTTLVEQVLAAHPQVTAGGECHFLDDIAHGLKRRIGAAGSYPSCAAEMGAEHVAWVAGRYLEHLASLDSAAARITDKMPTNFLHLGLIFSCLPNARIVHCARDPRDTALSLYVQQFSSGNDWAYRAPDIAAFYRQYERLMAHWHALAGEVGGTRPRLFELAYEDLVRDSEACVRALLDFLGLDWDERCLQPHRTRSAVRTASNWQVRQPMHGGSVGRYARFAAYLPELERAMAARSG